MSPNLGISKAAAPCSLSRLGGRVGRQTVNTPNDASDADLSGLFRLIEEESSAAPRHVPDDPATRAAFARLSRAVAAKLNQ